MRLDRFLSETTDLTRSLAKKVLHRGEVTVNGEVVKQPAVQVGEQDRVLWVDEPLALVGLRYIMLNKPAGVECTARRGLYPRAIDLIELPKAERLQTVGRLDVDTTGMVLLTDDGQWSHRVTSPRKRCGKLYRVTLADPLEGEALENAVACFAEGVVLDGEEKPTQPAELAMLTPVDAELTLYEGKYHQVKRMFGAIGNRVEGLHRVSIGPLSLGELAPGKWRELTDVEVAAFF
ncbi:pseudouridine synthase [Billgrantia montanilacus]|uniref:Dual-specificity RNA pseudouridine synthase RluF n=1 Tax=Billgrantia montanilacus TaxID=2282305 RepID=A0A368TS26_9GAMM|nr:pseudouridine synthase [Halomonas montanilacus]RCV87525.1 pseudouridine synthase [Halomonas montanilacus]